MLVKIISGTYGHRPLLPTGQRSHYVIPVKAGEAPIEVNDAEGDRLIALGVAEAAKAGETKAPTAEVANEAHEAVSEGEKLEDMTFTELKAVAQEMGIDTGKIRSKNGLIEAITAAQDPEDGFPALDAQDVID